MVLPDEKQGVPLRLVIGIVPIAVLLTGCADTSSAAASQEPEQDQHIVDGQGTAQDRSVIESTNQKIFETEHIDSPDVTIAPPPSPAPPANSTTPASAQTPAGNAP